MGGNAKIANVSAMHVNLQSTSRQQICDEIEQFLQVVNQEVAESTGDPIWQVLPSPLKVLSGSTQFLFDPAISTSVLTAEYPIFGDIDIQVPEICATTLSKWVATLPATNKFKCIGMKPGNSQIVTLWEFVSLQLTLQVDFEFVQYNGNEPSEWSQFSRLSSFDDVLFLKTKGVHHKWFLQSLTRANLDTFNVLTRNEISKVEDCHYSLAITSKEGGGLRRKYVQLPIEDDRVFVSAPCARYIQDCSLIFETLLGDGYDHTRHFNMLRSLHGAVILANQLLTAEQKMKVFVAFAEKCFGSSSQVIMRNNKMLDFEMKQFAINYLSKEFDFPQVVFRAKEL